MQKTKEAVSLLLSFLLVLSCFTCLASVTAFAADGGEQADTYVVAGSNADIFGTAWDPAGADNAMTKNAGGKYEKKYTVTKAFEDVQLKVVKNSAEWIGDSTGSNITFDLTGAGDFTVTIDPETNEIAVTGTIVEFKTTFEYTTVFAVGNGEGFWLNGSSWTPDYAANEMTEVEEDVWEISFENVPDGFERQIKFAIDGAWTHNFGGAFEESGVETDAAYGGDNISFDTEEDSQTVTARLDLTGFDFATKTGAKFTITITPDTEEETTEPEPQEDATFVVAGSQGEIFGTAWDATNEDNLMTKAGSKYEKTYTVAKAYEDVQLKVVKNGAEWIGDSTGSNITFDLTGAGNFTVTIDPETNEITVTGDIVEFKTEFVYDTVFAVGNGEGFWLNGSSWTPDYAANEMTEIAEDVWEISFENVPDGFERQIKFAIDGAWTHNFGGAFEESGVETDAAYGGDNISFDTEEDSQTVTAKLDLTGFDFATKTGAKFTITITPDSEEETTEPEPQEDATFVVAGSEGDIFGTTWDASNQDNLMTENGGKFEKTYTVTKAYEDVQLKVVKNGAEWIGDSTGSNVTFDLTAAGDFTVTIDPETNEITVTGDYVFFKTEFVYDTVFAVGNGEGFWLNGASWDPAFAANEMNEVAENLWEISFENVPDGFERQIKFAIDGAWTHNFGGVFEDSGVVSDAAYGGDNISFDTEEDTQTVKVQLDLREFDFATKTGAKFTIEIITDEEGDVVYGDVDGDGFVKINDATAIQRHLAEREGCIIERGTREFTAADVNGDGDITIDDVTLVQQYLAEYISVFPVEEPV